MADGQDPAAYAGVRFTACPTSQLLGGQPLGNGARRTHPDHSQVNERAYAYACPGIISVPCNPQLREANFPDPYLKRRSKMDGKTVLEAIGRDNVPESNQDTEALVVGKERREEI